MTRPIGMEPSPLPAVPRKGEAARVRILVVAGEGAGSAARPQSLRQLPGRGRPHGHVRTAPARALRPAPGRADDASDGDGAFASARGAAEGGGSALADTGGGR